MSNRQEATWPLDAKIVARVQKARDSRQLEEQIAANNFQIRMTEILEIGRPDNAPSEARFDGKAAFCLPEFLPDKIKRAMGIEVAAPDSPKPSTD